MEGSREKETKRKGTAEQVFELSEEVKITPDQEKHIKELGGGRMIVSSKPISESEEDEEKEELDEKKLKEEVADQVLTALREEKGEKTGKKSARKEEPFELNPLKLVSILASYNVEPGDPVKDLIKEIRRRGEDHLNKQLERYRNK